MKPFALRVRRKLRNALQRLKGPFRSKIRVLPHPPGYFFKARVFPGGFFIEGRRKGWTYFDGTFSGNQHNVLFDSQKRPVALLQYKITPVGNSRGSSALKDISILSIQREYPTLPPYARNRYHLVEMDYYSEDAQKMSRSVKKETGRHPSELLLDDFLLHNRGAILGGSKVWLVIPNSEKVMRNLDPDAWEKMRRLYAPIVARYFMRRPAERGDNPLQYELNLKKRRVRRALGLK